MIKTSSYFLVAALLIIFMKLIVMFFYEELKPHHPNEKEHVEVVEGEEVEKEVAKVEKQKPAQNQEKAAEIPVNEEVAEEVSESKSEKANIAETSTATGETYFTNLKNSYLSPIIASLPEGRSREDVVVRYYKHHLDENKVYALRKLGYYLHEKEPEDNVSLASNALYYGSDIDSRDIQIVAYTLIKNGVLIKAIVPSQYDWKYNSLEIGADSIYSSRAAMTITEIEAFTR